MLLLFRVCAVLCSLLVVRSSLILLKLNWAPVTLVNLAVTK